MENDYSNLEEWAVNLEKVAADRQQPTVVRFLASTLMAKGYITIGSFLESLSADDLQLLLEYSDGLFGREFDKGAESILLITLMLSHAEGSPPVNQEELSKYLSAMALFLTGTSLHRKGLVKAHYKNMSFHDDSQDKIVFEKV